MNLINLLYFQFLSPIALWSAISNITEIFDVQTESQAVVEKSAAFIKDAIKGNIYGLIVFNTSRSGFLNYDLRGDK
jgi:hypothetical protein